MTDEQQNIAQDILDGLLRDAYSRGFADATNDQKIKPINETMTTYNLQVLIRMAQHHYGSTDVPQPTAEEVEYALNNIMCEVMELEDRIAEMLDSLHQISLASQSSMDSKEECGRIARETIRKIKGEEK